MYHAFVNNIPDNISAAHISKFLESTLLTLKTDSISIAKNVPPLLSETKNLAILSAHDYQYKILSGALANIILRDGTEEYKLQTWFFNPNYAAVVFECDWGVSDAEVGMQFSAFGAISSVLSVERKDGNGYRVFVQFESKQIAQQCVEAGPISLSLQQIYPRLTTEIEDCFNQLTTSSVIQTPGETDEEDVNFVRQDSVEFALFDEHLMSDKLEKEDSDIRKSRERKRPRKQQYEQWEKMEKTYYYLDRVPKKRFFNKFNIKQ